MSADTSPPIPEGSFSIDLPDEAATAMLAADLALVLGRGDVVALVGDLGAGKTTFARAFVRALGDDPAMEVPSPTYTLAQIYETRPKVTHFDLYRLGDESELEELGFDEATETGIVLVEWPERAPHTERAANLRLELRDAPGGGRHAHLRTTAEAARRVSRTLRARGFLGEAGFGEARRRAFPGDASARRYETASEPGAAPMVLMDSPRSPLGPPVRDGRPYAEIAHLAREVAPFVAVAGALERAGLAVPRILHADLDAGFVLMTDLGREGVLDSEGRPIPERYEATMGVLAHLHAQPFRPDLPVRDGRTHCVPPFDRDALLIEIDQLLDWAWPHRKGRAASKDERDRFQAVWNRLFDRLDAAETSILLRDIHSPNLLWQEGEAGIRRIAVLDFQDAMVGPTAYDVASLAQDARVDIAPELEQALVRAYIAERKAQDAFFDEAAFREAYAIMAAQRATKIMGIFVRLLVRDGKPQYLRHIPRIQSYMTRTLAHPVLAELAALYEEWSLLEPAPTAQTSVSKT